MLMAPVMTRENTISEHSPNIQEVDLTRDARML